MRMLTRLAPSSMLTMRVLGWEPQKMLGSSNFVKHVQICSSISLLLKATPSLSWLMLILLKTSVGVNSTPGNLQLHTTSQMNMVFQVHICVVGKVLG